MAKWRVNQALHVDTCLDQHGNVVVDFDEGEIDAAPGSPEAAVLAHLADADPPIDNNTGEPGPPLVELLEADPEPVEYDPAKATAAEVLERVADDPIAAAEALAAEEQRHPPRKTLIAALAAIVNPEA